MRFKCFVQWTNPWYDAEPMGLCDGQRRSRNCTVVPRFSTPMALKHYAIEVA